MSRIKHISEVFSEAYPYCRGSRLCPYPPLKSGFCLKHQAIEGIVHTKEKKPISKVSEKRKKESKVYQAIVKSELDKNPLCEIKAPGCTKFAEGMDHTQKRSPKNWLDRKNMKRACNNCNLYKELHPEWSKENGHEISRFKK